MVVTVIPASFIRIMLNISNKFIKIIIYKNKRTIRDAKTRITSNTGATTG